MVHKHADLEKDDDRWLYMPSLDLVKRIAASDKRTSFVGSDFLYEDISGRSPEDDFHELIETTEKYYVIKNTPRKPESVEFAHYTAYIDKKNFLPMKIEFFKNDGRVYRVIESLQVDTIEAEQNGQTGHLSDRHRIRGQKPGKRQYDKDDRLRCSLQCRHPRRYFLRTLPEKTAKGCHAMKRIFIFF